MHQISVGLYINPQINAVNAVIGDYLVVVARYGATSVGWATQADRCVADLDAIDADLAAIAAGVPVTSPPLGRGHWSQAERQQVVAAIAAQISTETGRVLRAAFSIEARPIVTPP